VAEPTGEARALVPPTVIADLGLGAGALTAASDPGAGAALPDAAATKRAIVAAGAESARAGAPVATPRHVLAALALDTETDVGRALRAAGVSPERLREQ
jgi:hypothetical protein